MNEGPTKTSPDLRPLTLEHGQKLFAKSEHIGQQLALLMPLLALLEVPPMEEGNDPIETILRLLETLSVQQRQIGTYLDEIDAKLDLLLANFNINVP